MAKKKKGPDGNKITHADRKNTLTPRALEILTKITEGKTNTLIAAELNISIRTVENLIAVAIDKLQAKNICHAVSICCSDRIIKIEHLSYSELEVKYKWLLIYTSAGYKTKEIAELLSLSASTIEKHISETVDIIGGNSLRHSIYLAYCKGYLKVKNKE